MDFIYDDEQDALREAVRGLVGKAYGDYENRRQAWPPRMDRATPASTRSCGPGWPRWACSGLPFAEEDGGVGAGPVEIGIVCQELGRVIAPEPYLTSVVLAGGLVSACGTAEQRAGAPRRAVGGRERAGLRPRRARTAAGAPAPSTVTAAQDGDAWTLTGVKEPVPHGARADLLVVSAALPDGGTGLFLVERRRSPSAPATRRTTAAGPRGSPSTAPRRRRWASPASTSPRASRPCRTSPG